MINNGRRQETIVLGRLDVPTIMKFVFVYIEPNSIISHSTRDIAKTVT